MLPYLCLKTQKFNLVWKSDDLKYYFFFFLWPHPWHMVPKLGVESEMQLPAYATTTATPDLSHMCNLHIPRLLETQVKFLTHWARPAIKLNLQPHRDYIGSFSWSAIMATPWFSFFKLLNLKCIREEILQSLWHFSWNGIIV